VRYLAAGEEISRLVGEQRNRRIEHGEIDFLPSPGAFAREQRHRDTVGGEHARDDVDDRDAEAVRRAVGRAGDAHQPAFGLHDRVVSRLLRSRAGVAEPGMEQ
jgi:hypothetical protein